MHTKAKATAHQLEEITSQRMRGCRVIIHRDPMYGWGANLIASPAQAISLNGELQQIVAELRYRYDLSD
ncbi:hypothetical protein [Bradyrhizobium sp. 192]|uniref:hypothetical protein n=1 Tax=Bradyrhizobium sp. 192 TaxID=2782660 RepID=UPI001FFF4560|nr:hypothetical protein [Bradyrhizobium sp. 192]UPJ57930.1 hypothetical protein IVB24_36285 [Bradyrhizobium sp. 192]